MSNTRRDNRTAKWKSKQRSKKQHKARVERAERIKRNRENNKGKRK